MKRSLLFLCLMSLMGTRLFCQEFSGLLIKKYYLAPSVVKNPSFGWYVVLNSECEQVLKKLKSDPCTDLSMVQCVNFNDSIQKDLHRLENCNVRVKGVLDEPSSYYQIFPCFSVTLQEIEKVEGLVEFFEEKKMGGSEKEDEETQGEPLELKSSNTDILVSLKGNLILKLLSSSPYGNDIERGGRPCYCWFLKLTPESFQTAVSTPVLMAFQTPQDIMKRPDRDEIQLGSDFAPEKWLCEHVNKEVQLKGYLFHAHTGHHHSLMLMDVKEIICNTK